ncbi:MULTISPECIES: transglycosylase SLT domain-containing protein [Acinetobacter]|uniref:transglycosylase SLT domain-containing protein n=1 Tax=Acinetobacter TaxID=469 RepID=UPI0006659ED4|nr:MULTISPECIES: transglycosylase SLT domain-containing protein [Acinetobacter]KRJ76141.1 replication protein [Acinetobacter pittii]MDA3462742.1 transglycosylase SLT domain-containing protein [Acinetobacter sp. AOR41_HL]
MATNSLGRLTLDLVVQTASFSEPLSKAERQARASSQGIANSLNIAAIAVSALGGALAGLSIASLVNFSEKVIQTGSDIQKFSKLANASVRDFQYFAKGAETAGISMESFADKMKDMQDRIGEFQQTGGGPLADFFENIAPRVGVTIQQFQKLSGPEALQLFYNSLEKAGASTNDMKFYMEAIISDSSLLIPLLEKGGKGFKEWGDAAEKAGAIMSDELAANLSEAKKQLMLMDLQWQGLENRLINNVVPAVKMVIDNWGEIKAIAIAVSAGIATRFVPALVLASYQLGQTALFAARAGIGLYSFSKSAGVARSAIALLGGPAGIGMLIAQLAVAGGAYYLMTKQTQDATDALEEQGLSVDELREKYKKLTASQLAIRGIQANDEIEKQTKELKSLFTALEQFEHDLKVQGDVNQLTAIQNYLNSLKEGGDKAKNAFAQLQSQGLVSESTLKFVAELDSKINDANNSINHQKEIQALVKNVTDETTKAQQAQAKALNISTEAYKNLTKAQRDYITQAKLDASRENYIKGLVDKGFTVDKANAFAEAQASTNGNNAYKVPLTDLVRKATEDSFKRKNYTPSPSEKKAIAYVQSLASEYNFSKIESLRGLPSGTLAALILNESSGNPNARSKTGAKGLLQTTKIFRDEYQITDKSTLEEIVTAAAEDLKRNRQKFGGSLDKALIAYNAGPTGTKNYLAGNIGSKPDQMSPEKAKEVAGYLPRYQKWFAAVNGKTTVDNSIIMPTEADQLEAINKAAEAQKAIDDMQKEVNSNYLTVPQKLAQEHKDRTEKAIIAFGGTDKLKEVLAQENALYKAQLAKFTSDTKDQYNQYFAFETDRIKQIEQNYDRQKELIDTDAEYQYGKSKEALEIKAGLERQKQVEIAAVKREEDAQIQSAFEGYLNQTEIVVKRYQREREEILQTYSLSKRVREEIAKSKDYAIFGALNQASDNVFQSGQISRQSLMERQEPINAQKWALQNQYSTDFGGINQSYDDQVSGIKLIENENERNAQLLAAREQFLKAKADLDKKYAQDEMDLNRSIYDSQLSQLSSLTSQLSGYWSNMTGIVKDAAGEQSGIYKAMYLAQQSFAIASATINAFQAYNQILASPWYLDVVSKETAASIVLGMGMANVGMIAGQTIAGMAHNGIDSVPKEGTWLLDGGERVLNPQQNKDLTNYLNNRQSGSGEGDVQISQQITFADGSANVSTQGKKQVAESLNIAMNEWARRESKQGGVLFNLVKR